MFRPSDTLATISMTKNHSANEIRLVVCKKHRKTTQQLTNDKTLFLITYIIVLHCFEYPHKKHDRYHKVITDRKSAILAACLSLDFMNTRSISESNIDKK